MKYVTTEGTGFQEEVWELDSFSVMKCTVETRREYPRVIKMIFWNHAYPITVREDGSGWVKIPKGLLAHEK